MESCYRFIFIFFGNQLSKAIAIFENDERFKAVERERDRKDMIESFLEELLNKVHSTI
jgi:hypothetical protein